MKLSLWSILGAPRSALKTRHHVIMGVVSIVLLGLIAVGTSKLVNVVSYRVAVWKYQHQTKSMGLKMGMTMTEVRGKMGEPVSYSVANDGGQSWYFTDRTVKFDGAGRLSFAPGVQ